MKKLYRSQRDKKIFGLCGGLAELFNIDATILRLIVAIGVVFSGGTVLLLYVVASLVIPKEPGFEPQHAQTGGGWSYGPHGPHAPHHAPHQQPYNQPHAGAAPQQHAAPPTEQQRSAAIDDMMKDIEKKAMQKEIEELKARLAKIEKGE